MDNQQVSTGETGSKHQSQPSVPVIETRKRRRAGMKNIATGMMPPADVESARKHMIAYFYAAYSNCNCDACVALRPIAKKIIENMRG
jgi:hypothetical protein